MWLKRLAASPSRSVWVAQANEDGHGVRPEEANEMCLRRLAASPSRSVWAAQANEDGNGVRAELARASEVLNTSVQSSGRLM